LAEISTNDMKNRDCALQIEQADNVIHDVYSDDDMSHLLIQSISSGLQKPGTQLGGGHSRHDCVLKGYYTRAVKMERKELRELEHEEVIGLFRADRI
jgi:hypothetical protein